MAVTHSCKSAGVEYLIAPDNFYLLSSSKQVVSTEERISYSYISHALYLPKYSIIYNVTGMHGSDVAVLMP